MENGYRECIQKRSRRRMIKYGYEYPPRHIVSKKFDNDRRDSEFDIGAVY